MEGHRATSVRCPRYRTLVDQVKRKHDIKIATKPCPPFSTGKEEIKTRENNENIAKEREEETKKREKRTKRPTTDEENFITPSA